VEIDVGVFAMGMHDTLSGGKLLMTREEMQEALGGVLGDLQQKQRQGRAQPAAPGAAAPRR